MAGANYRKILNKTISLGLSISFLSMSIWTPSGQSQNVSFLPPVGTKIELSPSYVPPSVKGLYIDPNNPFQLEFIINRDNNLNDIQSSSEYMKIIKYFMAALTVPDNNQWVNLSPYESNRIIPPDLNQTEMGRDLLAQDYLLKQLTSSLMHPDSEYGEQFWSNIYQSIYEKHGNINDIPVNTFNKIWIVPDEAVVYEKSKDHTVWILYSHLKVMTEEEYFMTSDQRPETKDQSEVSSLQSQVLKEFLLPAIEKEVNEGEHFAKLRQIYHAMILATWFKNAGQSNMLNRVYVDKSKTQGINLVNPEISKEIYNQYIESFKKGVVDLIRDEYDPVSQQIIPRKYFSGGFNGDNVKKTTTTIFDLGMLPPKFQQKIQTDLAQLPLQNYVKVHAKFDPSSDAAVLAPVSEELAPLEMYRNLAIETFNSFSKANRTWAFRQSKKLERDFPVKFSGDYDDRVVQYMFARHLIEDESFMEYILTPIRATHYATKYRALIKILEDEDQMDNNVFIAAIVANWDPELEYNQKTFNTFLLDVERYIRRNTLVNQEELFPELKVPKNKKVTFGKPKIRKAPLSTKLMMRSAIATFGILTLTGLIWKTRLEPQMIQQRGHTIPNGKAIAAQMVLKSVDHVIRLAEMPQNTIDAISEHLEPTEKNQTPSLSQSVKAIGENVGESAREMVDTVLNKVEAFSGWQVLHPGSRIIGPKINFKRVINIAEPISALPNRENSRIQNTVKKLSEIADDVKKLLTDISPENDATAIKALNAEFTQIYRNQADSYLKYMLERGTFKQLPFSAKQLAAAEQRAFAKHGVHVPWILALAQARQEGAFSAAGTPQRNNPMNVGKYGYDWKRKQYITKFYYKTIDEGLDAYFDLMAKYFLKANISKNEMEKLNLNWHDIRNKLVVNHFAVHVSSTEIRFIKLDNRVKAKLHRLLGEEAFLKLIPIIEESLNGNSQKAFEDSFKKLCRTDRGKVEVYAEDPGYEYQLESHRISMEKFMDGNGEETLWSWDEFIEQKDIPLNTANNTLKKTGTDSAVLSDNVGGIDFNKKYLNMKINTDNIKKYSEINSDSEDLKIDGLVPVILKIEPVKLEQTL